MSKILVFLVFLFLGSSCLFIPSYTLSQRLESKNEVKAFISIKLSDKGLNFIKKMALVQALESMTPIILPNIEQTAQIPFMGDAQLLISHISIIQISHYWNDNNSTGIELSGWGEVCNLTINVNYPFFNRIADHRCAAIQVHGMELGHELDLQFHNGKFKVSFMDYSYTEKHVSASSNEEEGSNSLFQRMIYAFERPIGVLLQNVISKKFREQIVKFNSFMQAPLHNDIPVDDIASLNVTLLKGVSVDNSYTFHIDGLFIPRNKSHVPDSSFRNPKPPVFCSKKSKLIEFSIDEAVFNSASSLYFDAKYMQWIVDKLPDGNLQNTTGWSSILPQLQNQYPNSEVKLKISLTSPPVIGISEEKIDAIADAELTINVLKADQLIPIACFYLKMNVSGKVGIIEEGIRVGVNVKLNDLSVSLGWTSIGYLDDHLYHIERFVETVLFPYANAKLGQGFRVPGFYGLALWEAEIIVSNSKVTLCADLLYLEPQ